MSDEIIQDLKQFITSAMTQATAEMATKDDLLKLEVKMDRGFVDVMTTIGDTIVSNNDFRDQQYSYLLRRITKYRNTPKPRH